MESIVLFLFLWYHFSRELLKRKSTKCPVSNRFQNYTSIVNQVSYGNRVYLTKNGHGHCALIDIGELDELEKKVALLQLMTKLSDAKASVKEEGTISADDLEKELGV